MQQASSVSQGLENGEAQMTSFTPRENSLDFQNHVFLGTESYISKRGARYDVAVSPGVIRIKVHVCQESFHN